ncbi:interleukin-2 receptor subunit alpha isoform X1 [Saimiri boliviensis]|uniref:interleukin-2 receptor subunit alpha isoform X1 n=1 Tax=Saimiri boliviensis TaxID=27679 RepID=UPI003D778FAA
MDSHLLMWGLLTFIMVPGCLAELCDDDPPKITYATFKALAYKEGTMLNCECNRGFRRIKSGSPYMLCTGNSSHASWENQCQCISSSPRNTTKQVTPQPEEQKERKTTEVHNPRQQVDQSRLPGHCREPPHWENEGTERIYHFVVGQTVHYQCIQGYRALHRGPAKSICTMTHGKTRWTQPQLVCTKQTEPSQFPGEEEPQASPDSLLESETSCLITTTGAGEFPRIQRLDHRGLVQRTGWPGARLREMGRGDLQGRNLQQPPLPLSRDRTSVTAGPKASVRKRESRTRTKHGPQAEMEHLLSPPPRVSPQPLSFSSTEEP